MSSIIKRNVILTPAEYDGVANQKGIVTFEILNNEASGFLRCYNLESKENLVFGVKVNDQMFKYKLTKGFDYLNFSLGNIKNLQFAKISCVLVRVNNNKSNTLLIGSTETTSIYSNEILNFLNEDSLENEKLLEDKLKDQKESDNNTFKIHDFYNSNTDKIEEPIKFEPEFDNKEDACFEDNSTQINENLENKELSNYIDDLTSDNFIENKCQNCMYKNYFYCKNTNENINEADGLSAVNSMSANGTKSENTQPKKITTQTAFYDSLSSQIDTLISNNIHEEVLEEVIPNSTFVRIEKESGSYYVLGIINNEDGVPEYLCYGHPAKNINDKPFNYDNHFSFFPLSVDDPQGEGYYLSYQSAQNGENIKVTLI